MDKEGLTSEEAKKNLEEHGFNEIEDYGKISPFKIIFRQIKGNFILYLLLLSVILSFIVGKLFTAYVIIGVMVIVIFTGFIQEYRAELAISHLKKLVVPVSIVIRDGKEKEILTREIVPGDLIVLRTGEKIPADCVIISEKNLLVNESILTGEAEEIRKSSAKNIEKYDEENLILMGSFVVSGKCMARVVYTGMNTKFGKIAKLISSAEKELPLQKKVNRITKYMAFIGIFMALLTGFVVLLGSSISKEVLVEVLILTIAISVSAFPEGFPVVLTTTLSVGVSRMAKKNAIVNRMSIIETLGETTVICSDKTGTITKGEMTVKKIFSDNKLIEVKGVGYEGTGDFVYNGSSVNFQKEKTVSLLIKSGVLCNDSTINRVGEDNLYSIRGAPTEASILIMGAKANLHKEDLNFEIIDEVPFSSERKMMSVVVRQGKETNIFSKGALNILLEKCKYIQRDSGVFRLLEKDRKAILEENKKMTSKSLRTIGFAYRNLSSKTKDIENDLIFLGFVGIEDSPREEVSNAVALCRRAGIKIKMITGDDKITALSIAMQIGLDSGKTLEGQDIDDMSDEELAEAVKTTVIFARVKPEHKLRIVRALKENGEIVTMTGDGVNDAPALKEAHIGVAMGKNGTDVSRSVADLTLKDDNFATIVDAVKEGRTIFNNIKKFSSYQLSCNFAELSILFLGVLLAPVLGWPIPILLALHILFMNIVTDNLPAITLGFNKSSEDIMNGHPKKSEILNKPLFILVVFAGTVMALFTLLVFYFTFSILGQSVEDARTTTLLALIVIEIAGAFSFRSFRKKTLTRSPFSNIPLIVASLISLIATFLIIYTPLNKPFSTIPIPGIDWVVALGFAFLFIIVMDVLKWINERKNFWNPD
jgi:Ca2+-transporting ATPase